MVTNRTSDPIPPAKIVTPTGIQKVLPPGNHRYYPHGSCRCGEKNRYHATFPGIVGIHSHCVAQILSVLVHKDDIAHNHAKQRDEPEHGRDADGVPAIHRPTTAPNIHNVMESMETIVIPNLRKFIRMKKKIIIMEIPIPDRIGGISSMSYSYSPPSSYIIPAGKTGKISVDIILLISPINARALAWA